MTQRSPSKPTVVFAPWTRTAAWWTGLAALTLGACFTATQVRAQGATIFKGADLKQGEQLIAEHRCAQCHAQKMGGDGSGIYRPMGRINNAGLLRGMVEQCSTMLNLQLFPEDVNAVAAVLNRDHYKFKD